MRPVKSPERISALENVNTREPNPQTHTGIYILAVRPLTPRLLGKPAHTSLSSFFLPSFLVFVSGCD